MVRYHCIRGIVPKVCHKRCCKDEIKSNAKLVDGLLKNEADKEDMLAKVLIGR